MLVFAGLGNPGSQYQDNRHNVGFMAVDHMARRHSFSPWTKKFRSLVADGLIGGKKVLLVKPQTFMNLSGEAIGEAIRFYKLDAGALSVFHDELDLPPGKVRVKIGGGNGGHNGLRSIDAHIAGHYRRVRIGIGHPGTKNLVQPWVLGNFAKADAEWLDPLLDAMSDNANLLEGDGGAFMNRLALAGPKGGSTSPITPAPAPKGQSHIRQARPSQPQVKLPETGPMAAMLRKLLGRD